MRKILIIEDEIELLDEVAYILKQEGFDVLKASDGIVGFDLAKDKIPDLVLCDVLLPQMDGFQVIREFKRHEVLASKPFIFISALSEREERRKGMEEGADDYLTKPFTREELLKAIDVRINKYEQMYSKFRFLFQNENNELEELKSEVRNKEQSVRKMSTQFKTLQLLLKEKENELMAETLKGEESKNVLKKLNVIIENELYKSTDAVYKGNVLLKMKKYLNEKSLLLNNWAAFQLRFNHVYPGFTEKLTERFDTLTQYDIVFICATKMGMNTSQIAHLFNISDDSVRKSRYRIKKKLGLKREDNFVQFTHSFSSN
ncbi:response regulator transcription factor [Maribellus maritimus]|uniref:response regulator transcription factor n=1 Tax=Maribellus maritimus TaxID=2870838 RepID=UPI001EEC9F14|nr:response regulator transcription factor [Maribellus maritimus]MCG6188863.1 response regulator transcription factor [Maribellus maritimus]